MQTETQGPKREFDASRYLEELYEIYRQIDERYQEVASIYGFSCEGCEDNCCQTVFYHYTLIEYFALLEGFDRLPQKQQEESLRRAKAYIDQLNRYRQKETEIRLMCPLNQDGLCTVYQHRPLICRVHGLPGILRHPRKGRQVFEGCNRFQSLHQRREDLLIDRTPYFTRIATLESRLRTEMDYMLRFRKTVAEMIYDRSLLSYL